VRAVLFLGVLLLGHLPPIGPPLHAQPSENLVVRVLKDWEQRQERIQRIRYVVKGQSIVPKGSRTDEMNRPLVPPAPPRDIAQKQDTMLLLDIPGKRFRMERDHQSYWSNENRLVVCLATDVFDGNSLYGHLPREANAKAGYIRKPLDPDICISRNYAAYRPLKAVNAYWLSPLLFAHGLVPQLTAASSFLDKLDIDDFTIHGQGVHAGRPCLVLRTFPAPNGTAKCFDEYWVDLARDCAVLRHSAYLNDNVLTDVDIAYQQTPHGWLPLRWEGTVREQGRQLINVTRLRVAEFTVEPTVTDADFRVEAKPGMIILEDTYDLPEMQRNSPGVQRKNYRVGADGSWEEIGAKGEPLPPRRQWAWFALLAVPATIALAYVWRRRRSSCGKTGPVEAVS
jgi:hypothetical protein